MLMKVHHYEKVTNAGDCGPISLENSTFHFHDINAAVKANQEPMTDFLVAFKKAVCLYGKKWQHDFPPLVPFTSLLVTVFLLPAFLGLHLPAADAFLAAAT